MLTFSKPEDGKCENCSRVTKPFEVPKIFSSGKEKWVRPPRFCDFCLEIQDVAKQKERAKQLEQERIIAAFVDSQVPPLYKNSSFDNFKVNDGNRMAFEAAKGFKINDSGKGLYFFGSVGVGKTSLVTAIANKLMGEVPLLYLSCPSLILNIKKGLEDKTYKDKIEIAQKVQLLFLDDLGIGKSSEWLEEILFSIINHRYEHRYPTIFTSNCNLQELSQWIGERISSRIAGMCDYLQIKDKDNRAVK